MFNNIAPTYDRLNHIFSLSIDKLWRRRVVRLVRRMKPQRILDLATGTGKYSANCLFGAKVLQPNKIVRLV